jgi:hypothetical protein
MEGVSPSLLFLFSNFIIYFHSQIHEMNPQVFPCEALQSTQQRINMSGDLISDYIEFASESSESPVIYHRWSIIASIGAYLGRQYYFEHGHFVLYPNQYCMLIGTSGARKSSAIKIAKRVLQDAGYGTIAADRTSKEKFLLDLAGETGEEAGTKSAEQYLDGNLFGDIDETADREMFIMADEFNDFIGLSNHEFISMLGTLWDYTGVYTNRIKTGKSVSINNPTVSILGGNTPTNFSLAFPPETLGQGFLSRMLLIYGEKSGKKIAFPKAPDPRARVEIVTKLKEAARRSIGQAVLHPTAESLLEHIYNLELGVGDVRFDAYTQRRFSHLLKLCLVVSAAKGSSTILEADVVYANTILSYAERLMPKALGEFGKAKHSDVTHKILQLIDGANDIVPFKSIWKHVSQDLEKQTDLVTLIHNLVAADKIQAVGNNGFLPKKQIVIEHDSSVIDWSLLTDEERNFAI